MATVVISKEAPNAKDSQNHQPSELLGKEPMEITKKKITNTLVVKHRMFE